MTTLLIGLLFLARGQEPAVSVTTNPKAARRQIQIRYDKWSKAYMSMDVETLLSILTPDYVLVNFQKETTSLAQYSAYLNLRKKSGYKDPVKTSTAITGLNLLGPEADVNATETMVTEGTDPETRLPAKCLHRHEYLDVWRFADGNWRLGKTTTLKESTTYRLTR